MKIKFNGNYCYVPADLCLNNDKSTILTYVGVSRYMLLRKCEDINYSVFSLRDLCENANYSSTNKQNDSYLRKVRGHLKYFEDRGLLKIVSSYKSKFNDFTLNDTIKVALNPSFFPKTDFAKISDEEFNTLVGKSYTVSKEKLVAVYTYIKSYMYDSDEFEIGKFCAFFKDVSSSAHNLNISVHQMDRCLKFYLDNGLLIKYQTGSYKFQGNILNAPNIYVLNNEKAKSNINSALYCLRKHYLKPEYGNKEEFILFQQEDSHLLGGR